LFIVTFIASGVDGSGFGAPETVMVDGYSEPLLGTPVPHVIGFGFVKVTVGVRETASLFDALCPTIPEVPSEASETSEASVIAFLNTVLVTEPFMRKFI
jgi:hypothetical protein